MTDTSKAYHMRRATLCLNPRADAELELIRDFMARESGTKPTRSAVVRSALAKLAIAIRAADPQAMVEDQRAVIEARRAAV